MIKLKSLAASLSLALFVVPAYAQGVGELGPGQVLGNASAFQGRAAPTNVTALLDKAFGSTRGAILERGASGWVLIGPGTTGKPFVSTVMDYVSKPWVVYGQTEIAVFPVRRRGARARPSHWFSRAASQLCT
ncbi:hypothetical protein [Bradyrhizobium elkanii]|uniref:hypothetical protein n=1 Tax=Bradyrhizobium elkanii TaxID=29448 RepID=UPI00144991E4|nr:hypothetical protein [Bradyrhizobium elkanii]MCS3577662.1 hypothetical protein [Bradyrhizobium elkanii]MCS3720537.1 hypothetical protein [Bradyrhizobium elkanii]MCS4004954.1 hypothetical protein [Bradyrhizobium elkanii USDA 61]BBC00111.1 hypothetical protein BE61_55650 [Bradyrhizobium elkanii USDA 61]